MIRIYIRSAFRTSDVTHSNKCSLLGIISKHCGNSYSDPVHANYSRMSESIHRTAKEGFTSGSFYDNNRPSYTDGLVSHVAQNLYHGHSQDVKYHILELGAGTGKFTREILKKIGNEKPYLATEPSESFLQVLQEGSPGLETLVCSAKSIPLPDNSVQNIVCAQSFHWFADQDSMKEITRILTPHGRLICVWNNKDWTVGWVEEMEKVLTMYYDEGTPRAVNNRWKEALEACPAMETVEEMDLPGVANMKGDFEFVINHFCSISVIARLQGRERTRAHQQFQDVLNKYFTNDQTLHIPFKSHYYCAEKIPNR